MGTRKLDRPGLAATLSAVPSIPVSGLTLLLGVDRFMSEVRAITNLIGNVVATVVVARWDGALDMAQARRELDAPLSDAGAPVNAPLDVDPQPS